MDECKTDEIMEKKGIHKLECKKNTQKIAGRDIEETETKLSLNIRKEKRLHEGRIAKNARVNKKVFLNM